MLLKLEENPTEKNENLLKSQRFTRTLHKQNYVNYRKYRSEKFKSTGYKSKKNFNTSLRSFPEIGLYDSVREPLKSFGQPMKEFYNQNLKLIDSKYKLKDEK